MQGNKQRWEASQGFCSYSWQKKVLGPTALGPTGCFVDKKSLNSLLSFFTRTGLNVKYVYVYIFMGHAVAQLVEALRYKPEGRGFDFRWCHWNFSLTQSFRPHYGPGIDSASNRNEYQEYFLEVKVAGA